MTSKLNYVFGWIGVGISTVALYSYGFSSNISHIFSGVFLLTFSCYLLLSYEIREIGDKLNED